MLLSFHFVLYHHDQAKMPLLHWPDLLLGLSECPHFLRTCSTVLLRKVRYLQTHQGSEHNMLFLMNSPKIFSPRHPWFHSAKRQKRVFVPRDMQNRCTEGRLISDSDSSIYAILFSVHISGQLWEWRILAACVNRTWDLIGYISQLQFIVIFAEIYWPFFMKFLNNAPILSVGEHKNTFIKYNIPKQICSIYNWHFHPAQLAPGVSAGGKLGVDFCKG